MSWTVGWADDVLLDVHDVGQDRSERVLGLIRRLAARDDLDVTGEAEVVDGDVVASVVFDPREQVIWVQRLFLRTR